MHKDPQRRREYAHEMYVRHRSKRLTYAKQYRATHGAQHAAESKARYQRAPTYWRLWSLQRKFGLSGEAYQAMLDVQGGVCAICGRPETRTRNGRVQWLCVDHDHATGQVRGLLCHRCNTAIAQLDNSGLLAAAIAYLAR